MSGFEVPEPILNSPFGEPKEHWHIRYGEASEKRQGRRLPSYFWRDPDVPNERWKGMEAGYEIELRLVTLLRERVKTWRDAGYPGASRTTLELLQYWQREGRERRLFFAQVEAAETIIFLTEARADLRQGVAVPRDEPTEAQAAAGHTGFRRYACKMATGTGKTTVMGMLAAWSILNKVDDRADARFSDVVLVVCPNVTIRQRLEELKPEAGDASLYRTRDLVPARLMPALSRGRVVVTNWHVFEAQSSKVGDVSARVVKTGRRVVKRERIHLGDKTTTLRGKRYLSFEDFERQLDARIIAVKGEERDKDGSLKCVFVESEQYVETDRAILVRVLGREIGGKQNILVFNDEAHHAYRIRAAAEDADDENDGASPPDEDETFEGFEREATVWVEGLDRIHKARGINVCIDLSATPYFLKSAGRDTNRPFPWVVSDFNLTEAIEAGLVKIPQLAVRDTTGASVPGYFNIWSWILPQLSASERGGKRGTPKPEAILKYAHHPIAMLAGLWEQDFEAWAKRGDDPRPPVLIIVCKDVSLAKVVHEWIAEGRSPAGVPPAKFDEFRNREGRIVTVRVDSKVNNDAKEGTRGDEDRWMRFTLDSVGKVAWPVDRQQRPVFPEGFEELAKKLERPLDPPGRYVRCIVSVAMLTEGWDCNTVTQVIGLRPFMSQLLCEQVVGRALRRLSYDVREDGRLSEEVAQIFGVPFEIVPFKASGKGTAPPRADRHHVHAVPERKHLRITFPRVDGYTQAVRSRVKVSWDEIAGMELMPGHIPPEVDIKASLGANAGRPSLTGPGRLDTVGLQAFRDRHTMQELVFQVAADLTRSFLDGAKDSVPSHVLFPQVASIVRQYVEDHVRAHAPADKKDLFLSPYYGWLVERLVAAIRPDTTWGEAPEVPKYERSRAAGSTAEVDFWTVRDVREVAKSHVNLVVADTRAWEQMAAYRIDRHRAVGSFVKNAELGFAIPYIHDGRSHDYEPDFLVRFARRPDYTLVLETKGFDPLADVKRQAAARWVAAVSEEGSYGTWAYEMVRNPAEIDDVLSRHADQRP